MSFSGQKIANSSSLNDFQVLKFVNDSRIKKKQLKIRSFYLFHTCQNKCLKDINDTNTEICLKRCEQGKKYSFISHNIVFEIKLSFALDLDEFIDYKKSLTKGKEDLK